VIRQETPRVLPVHTLLCDRDVPLAAKCLASLARCSDEPIELIVHDDGTLNPAQIEPLRQAFPKVTFISRTAADALVRPSLANYPACDHFRQTNVFGLKLFDVAMIASLRGEPPARSIHYCDGDIYFFNRFHGLFRLPDGCDGVFLHDAHNTIGWRSWQALARRSRFVSHLNAGLFCVRPELFDLSRLEWYFRHRSPAILRHFAEQSAWAMLAARANGVRLLDPVQFPLAQPSQAVSGASVAVHYVQTYRHLLDRDTVAPRDSGAPAVDVRSVPAATVGAWSIGIQEARRFVRRFL
jgi:hypothetical protein